MIIQRYKNQILLEEIIKYNYNIGNIQKYSIYRWFYLAIKTFGQNHKVLVKIITSDQSWICVPYVF